MFLNPEKKRAREREKKKGRGREKHRLEEVKFSVEKVGETS